MSHGPRDRVRHWRCRSAVGLIYGILQYKARNRKNDAITEEATREQYAHPETYDERREELKKKLHPS